VQRYAGDSFSTVHTNACFATTNVLIIAMKPVLNDLISCGLLIRQAVKNRNITKILLDSFFRQLSTQAAALAPRQLERAQEQ
jgi:hypothetical protein